MGVYDYREQFLMTGQEGIDLVLLKDVLKKAAVDGYAYLQPVLDMLSESRTAEITLHQCAKGRLLLYLDAALPSDRVLYHFDANVLDVPVLQGVRNLEQHNLRQGQMLAALVSGLREVWHCQRGRGFHPELCLPDFLHICRALAADRAVFTALVCRELRRKGNPYPWRHLLAGEDADIAQKLEGALADGGTRNPALLHKALRKAWRQWFADENREAAADHAALDYMDRLLMECRSRGRTSEWIGRADIEPQMLARLGDMPGVGNYLDRHAKTLLRFGYRAQPSDAFNRVHFQHIQREIFS